MTASDTDVVETVIDLAEAERQRATGGIDGIIGRLHPLGWVAAAFGLAALVMTLVDTDYLVGNLAWWHWVLVLGTIVVSTQFEMLDALRRGIEKLSDYAINGAGVELRAGTLTAVAVGVAAFVLMWLLYDIEAAVAGGFGFGLFVASVLMGPVWVLAWGVFLLALYSSLSRYLARFIEADLIISEVGAMSWQAFGLIALLGLGYGVREGVNPRIDFWWADFSNRRKAWLDFVLHVTLFIPFLIAALRILWAYAKISLGFRPDRSGQGLAGTWPEGWRVWETWEQQGDAGQLPTGPIQAMIFVGFCLFLLQIVAETIKHGFTMVNREDLGGFPEMADAPLRVE